MIVYDGAGSILHHSQQDDGIVLLNQMIGGRTSLLLRQKAVEGSAVNEDRVRRVGALSVKPAEHAIVSRSDSQGRSRTR